MGLFNFLKPVEPHFKFLDGTTMTPKQFGNFLVTSAEPQIEPLLGLLFDQHKPGFELPLERPVNADPFPAKLFFLGLFLGSSLLHPMTILRTPESIIGDIFSGVQEEMLKIKMPNGLRVNPEDLIEVNKFIDMFNRLIHEELCEKITRDITNPKTLPPKATVMLLSLIILRYNNGNIAALESIKSHGFYHQDYIELTKAIDEVLVLPMYAINKTQVKFIEH